MTSPEVERAVLCAYAEREVGREALESSYAVLQTAAIPSQLPAHVVVSARSCGKCTKKPDALRHRVVVDSMQDRPSVTSAKASRAAYSPIDNRQTALSLYVRG